MSNSLEVAAQSGDTKAIEALMNKAFASKGILVRVTNSGSTLKVLLRNATYPQQQISDAVKRGIDKIHPVGFDQVSLSAERTSSTAPWHEQWPLSSPNVVCLDQVSADGDAEPGSDARPVNAAIDTKDNDTPPKWYQQTWLIVLFLVFIPLIGIPMAWLGRWPKQVKIGASAASAFFLILTLIPGLGTTNLEEVDSQETTEQTQSTASPQVDGGSDGADNATNLPSTQSEPSLAFGEAIKAATSAAEATQSARTPQQWSDVATSWQQAIDLLKDVPESDANYATAQTKIQEYQSNLDYSTANISRARQAQITLGQQIFQQNNSVFQVRGEATDTPTATTIFNKNVWNQLSHEQRVALAVYTKAMIKRVQQSPEEYVSTPSNAPVYSVFLEKTKNLCDDCWKIILGEPIEGGNMLLGETVLQGDTPWNRSEPYTRREKASDFAPFDLTSDL